jgi:class 3 adenylate cyclase
MTVLTLLVLFLDDIRVAYAPKSSDGGFYSFYFVALIMFSLEMIVFCLGQRKYLFPCPSFYFWLDLVAIFSVMIDIPWIWDRLEFVNNLNSEAVIAGKASRIGTKAARVVRVIRVLRMVRIAKILSYENRKQFFKRKAKMDEDHEAINKLTDISSPEKRALQHDAKAKKEPSAVSQKMIQLTNRRVILIVLGCILIFPFFDANFIFLPQDQFEEYGLVDLHRIPQDRNASGAIGKDLFRAQIFHYSRGVGNVLYLEICPQKACTNALSSKEINSWLRQLKFQPMDTTGTAPYSLGSEPSSGWDPSKNTNDSPEKIMSTFREHEISVITTEGCYGKGGVLKSGVATSGCRSTVYIDRKAESVDSAIRNAWKTSFIIALLVGSSVVFMWDAEFMVVEPLERMYNLVRKLADNPLQSLAQAEVSQVDEFETVILEKTLTKIGGLLQVGFGVAGASIIAKNMGRGELRAMEPGRKVTCAFAYIQIKNFSEIMSCLGESSIELINLIADIVHESVHSYYGAANKNTGDSFLLAWRLCEGILPGLDAVDSTRNTKNARLGTTPQQLRGGGQVYREVTAQELIDSALAAILKVRINIHRANLSGVFAKYVHNPSVVSSLGTSVSVQLTLGMHVGWAIEGAIGSKYKIDASYLSPNVNMTARLASASSQYQTDLILSHTFVRALSPAARKMCRKIDCVTVKGSTVPVDLYVFDILNHPSHFLERRFDADGCQQPINFGAGNQLGELQYSMPAEFKKLHASGVKEYKSGNWTLAKTLLLRAQSLMPHDGPTSVLLSVMETAGGDSPDDWKGYRKLERK